MEKDLTLAMSRSWAEIDLDSLEKNMELLKGILIHNAKFLGICKANAYGHGLVRVARKIEECKADYLAVACIEEAIELRKNGITIPILCLGQSDPELTNLICKYDITQTVEGLENGKLISEKAVKLKKKARIHVKIDTGMGKIGFYWPEAGNSKTVKKKRLQKSYQNYVNFLELRLKEFLLILLMLIIKNIHTPKLKSLKRHKNIFQI